MWLTVPVIGKSQLVNFHSIGLNNKEWKDIRFKHTNNIKNFYSKSKYFNDIYPTLSSFYGFFNNGAPQFNTLMELNIEIIKYLFFELEIKTKIFYSSSICKDQPQLKGLDKIIYILKELKATEYVTSNGPGASRYIDKDKFTENNIKLNMFDYKHPIYNQLHGDFIPNLSIIDLLFNEGPNSKNIL